MCKIFDNLKIHPIPINTNTLLCILWSLTSEIRNSDYNWVNILRIIYEPVAPLSLAQSCIFIAILYKSNYSREKEEDC